MNKLQIFLQENKAAIFDYLVFSISFSLGFIFPTLEDFISSPLFSFFILTALVLYTIGTWLKNLPLHERLQLAERQLSLSSFISFIAVHFVLVMVAVTFSMPAARIIIGLPPATPAEVAGPAVIISFIAAIFITWLVFRNGKSKHKYYSSGYLFRRELAGDICLVIGVSIFSFVIWEKAIVAKLFNAPMASIWDVWNLFFSFALVYMIFYLPLRYLYLVEDHFSRKTWQRLFLIYGLLLLKALFEMLKI